MSGATFEWCGVSFFFFIYGRDYRLVLKALLPISTTLTILPRLL